MTPDYNTAFTPTPIHQVGFILAKAGACEGKIHIDLGSGDGRLVIAAARLGAHTLGYETDNELVQKSRELIKRLNVCASIIHGDCLVAYIGQADIVTAYFPGPFGVRLIQKFQDEAKPGAVLVLLGDGVRCFKK